MNWGVESTGHIIALFICLAEPELQPGLNFRPRPGPLRFQPGLTFNLWGTGPARWGVGPGRPGRLCHSTYQARARIAEKNTSAASYLWGQIWFRYHTKYWTCLVHIHCQKLFKMTLIAFIRETCPVRFLPGLSFNLLGTVRWGLGAVSHSIY